MSYFKTGFTIVQNLYRLTYGKRRARNCKHTKSRHSKVKKALCNSKLKGMQSRRKRKAKGNTKQKGHVKYRATINTEQRF